MLTDIVNQLYDLMNMFENVQMDNNEFVALKVLILLSPGIFMNKGMQNFSLSLSLNNFSLSKTN